MNFRTARLGQEFLRWEIAVAVAGSIIGIDPYNQPDVELAKDLARAAIAGGPGARPGTIPGPGSTTRGAALRPGWVAWGRSTE